MAKENCSGINLHLGIRKVEVSEVTYDKEAILGTGSFGTVYRGTYTGASVAVKRIAMAEGESADFITEELNRELIIGGLLRHPHIVQMIAFAIEIDKHEVYLINELVEGYNLHTILFGKVDIALTAAKKVGIAKQITSAIAYMHGNAPPLIHQDIKPQNVLLSAATDFSFAKLCDFGLGRLRTNMTCSPASLYEGTPEFMAPECLLHHQPGRESSDIWSLGITLLELFTGKKAWKPYRISEFVSHLKEQKEKNCLPRTTTSLAAKYKKAVIACLSYEAAERATALQILDLLPMV